MEDGYVYIYIVVAVGLYWGMCVLEKICVGLWECEVGVLCVRGLLQVEGGGVLWVKVNNVGRGLLIIPQISIV